MGTIMPTHTPAAYPLKFTPIYKQKVWGGRKLTSLSRTLPGDASTPIGESWELSDLAQTALSGGGGASEHSVIATGPLAGKTLNEACNLLGTALLGDLQLTDTGEFPLLLKFLDSEQNLSIQVHPSEAYALAHPDAFLKSEAWYIIDALPGAVIYKGMREDVTPEQLQNALEQGSPDTPGTPDSPDSVIPLLNKVPVKKGDCHYLPSGTCHALGAGILAAEVQTPSDTTFRVFDWGRTDRELHIDQAMQCIHFGPAPPEIKQCETRSHIAGIFTTVSCLVMCEHFRIEKVRMAAGYQQEIPYDQPAIWMVLEGAAQIKSPHFETVPVAPGQTILIPASLNDAHLHMEQDTIWLEITFPKSQSTRLA